MNPQLVEQQWEEFERRVVPKDAGSIQRTEMRRAFYGGASSLFFIILQKLTPDREPMPEDLDMLSALKDELEAFAHAVMGGRA